MANHDAGARLKLPALDESLNCFHDGTRFEDDSKINHFSLLRHGSCMSGNWHCNNLIEFSPKEDGGNYTHEK